MLLRDRRFWSPVSFRFVSGGGIQVDIQVAWGATRIKEDDARNLLI